MTEFIVHGAPQSPYVRGALLGLEEKGADWRLAPVSFAGFQAPEHLERHPFGRIPVLDHGDFRLYETQAILRYLDRIIPSPALTPAAPRAEARMNQLCGITDCYVREDITFGVSFQRLAAPGLGLPVDEARIAASIPKARVCIDEIARLLGDQPYLVGEAVSIADLFLAPHLLIFQRTAEGAPMIEGQPKLAAWIERMNTRPSMAATSPDRIAEQARAA